MGASVRGKMQSPGDDGGMAARQCEWPNGLTWALGSGEGGASVVPHNLCVL